MAPTSRKTGPSSEELRQVRDRELELRRMSGEISCADCRRLKLKCDKKIPCSSCVRRGTELLCPLGSRGTGGQNTRNSVPGPSAYHSQRWKRKLTMLSERVRALEDALALESETRGGSGSHPLLAKELLAIKQSLSDDDEEEEDDDEEDKQGQVLSEFGTLTIDESRAMRYIGPVASESALLMEVLENSSPCLPITSSESKFAPNYFTPEILHSSRSFPFSPVFLSQDEGSLLSQLSTYLPPYGRATALYEAFFRNLSWFVAPVERSHFVSEIIPLFYPHRSPISPAHVRIEHAHDLALMFTLFACGATGDLTQSPINEEAERYHLLAKATLSVKSIMQGASLSGVQTILLLSSYDVHAGQKRSQEDAWKLIALGASMAAAIGLHRDPSRWGFNLKMIERRRRAFWELYEVDIWRSLESGRPSIFRPNVVDCEFPSDIVADIGEDGEPIESVTQWRYRFLRDIGTEICEKLTSSRPLRYRDVLELDRRIRGFAVHPFATRRRSHASDSGINSDFSEIYPLMTIWEQEEALLYIHRNFFARAILDFPDNPMRSPFAVSFLATYRSASTILRLCRDNMDQTYLIVLRIWQLWTLCLASGVIVGTVASLGPSVSFSTSAFVELEYTISLFEKFCDHTVARHGLPLLLKIREKALAALSQRRSRKSETGDESKEQTNLPIIRRGSDNPNAELLILHGTTRVVEQRNAAPAEGRGTPMRLEGALRERDFLLETAEESSYITSPYTNQHPVGVQAGQGVHAGGIPVTPFLSTSSTQDTRMSTPESDTWLSGLEQLLGFSTDVPQSFGGASQQQHQQGQGPVPEWQNDYPMKTVPDVTPSSIHVSIPIYSERRTTSGVTPDILLNETVSTEEWRQFMQQSGLSNTPPFDFALDSFNVPFVNPDQGQKNEAMMLG